jgi:ribonuclease P/MRP protein subunit RPP40
VSKAFDSCNHEILKKKLKRIGLSGKSFKVSSYMLDREQEVWFDNDCGGTFKINIGVGQGTILGPTFFKIYIIDMYKATDLFSMRFADDTNLIGVGNDRVPVITLISSLTNYTNGFAVTN